MCIKTSKTIETSRSIEYKMKRQSFLHQSSTIITFHNTKNVMVVIFTVVSVLKRCICKSPQYNEKKGDFVSSFSDTFNSRIIKLKYHYFYIKVTQISRKGHT